METQTAPAVWEKGWWLCSCRVSRVLQQLGRRHQGQGRKKDLSFPSIYLNTNNTKALQELGRRQIIINNFIQSRQISVLPQSRCS